MSGSLEIPQSEPSVRRVTSFLLAEDLALIIAVSLARIPASHADRHSSSGKSRFESANVVMSAGTPTG